MPVAGIICEYNPLHRGHEQMIRCLREQGMEAIVCVMSGNFVQRGEFAFAEKVARAEMAVCCGADLVLELPTPWSAATAEIFARGGVSLLQQTGVVTHLAFGSECGDASALNTLAGVLESVEFQEKLHLRLTGGKTFARCRRDAVAEILGEDMASLLDSPNNNLGVEYCRAIQTMKSVMKPITVQRIGAAHDGVPSAGIASASHIRQLMITGKEGEAAAFLPPAAAEILTRETMAGRAPVRMENCEQAVLAQLRRMEEADFSVYDSGGEGLYRRFYRAVQDSCTVTEILEKAKTKRYTYARLRRFLLAAYLNLELPRGVPPYIRLLAANETGRILLRKMKKNGVPVLTKAADVAKLGPEAEKLLRAEARRTDLYTLAFPNKYQSHCGAEWRCRPILL